MLIGGMSKKMVDRYIQSYTELELLAKRFEGRACIFGAGAVGRGDTYLLLLLAGFHIEAYFDNFVSEGEIVNGIKVEAINKLGKAELVMPIFVCMSDKYRKEIEKQFQDNNVKNYYLLDGRACEKVMQSVDEADETVKERYRRLYDDETFIYHKFVQRVGCAPDLENPKTFNEKLQFLKLHDRKPIYSQMVDKLEAKKYVSKIIGEEYVIPTIGSWKSVDDIDIESLPNEFVIKCNHDSGSVFVCKDKSSFDWETLKEKYERGLGINYYWQSREWPYKNVVPRIFAEQFVSDSANDVLPVYKFFCFSGKPVLLQAIQNDKTKDECIDYYDISWNKLDIKQNFPNCKYEMKRPNTLDEMVRLASLLSGNIPFVRVDFFEVDGHVYFSEFTFFSDSGFERFHPDEWDSKLGELINIERI